MRTENLFKLSLLKYKTRQYFNQNINAVHLDFVSLQSHITPYNNTTFAPQTSFNKIKDTKMNYVTKISASIFLAALCAYQAAQATTELGTKCICEYGCRMC